MAVIDLMNGDVASTLTAIGAVIVKTTAVLLLGTAISMFARGASAATRHMIWTLTLAGGLAVPVVAALAPQWNVPVPSWVLPDRDVVFESTRISVTGDVPSSNVDISDATPAAAEAVSAEQSAPAPASVRSAAAGPAESETETVTATTTVSAGSPSETASSSVSISRDVPAAIPTEMNARIGIGLWVIAIWGLGFALALAPTVLGRLRLAAIARRARPMVGGRWALLVPSVLRELDVRRKVRFVELDGAVMPMTWGAFRPIVLLPAGDFESTIEQRLDVLRHELAHVRRYDCLTQLIGQIACAVHWFNPLAWIAVRQQRIERERASDDEVLRAGSKASDYADYLLRVASSTHIVGAAALGGLAMARPSQMAERLMAVLDDRRRRGRMSRQAATRASVATAFAVSAIAALTPVAADARIVLPAVAAEAEVPATAEPDIAMSARDVGAPAAVAVADTVMRVELPVLASAPSPQLAKAMLALAAKGVPALATIPTAPAAVPCDRNGRGGNHNHSNWTSSDNGSKRWRVQWSEGDCSYEIDARGDIKFNRDITDIESISSGGSFTIEQEANDNTRRLVIRPASNGSLERTYSVNGDRHEYDADARAWLAESLIALERQTAFAADQRVPAILERSGVDGVLQEISLLGGDYARRRYYTKLLSLRKLDRTQVRRVVEQAGSSISSDYELAELLVSVAKLDGFGDDSHTAFVGATRTIESDYERRRVLNALLNQERLAPTTVQALLESASTIRSDYELAELLTDVSKRYAINEQTRPVYIKAVSSLKSDYEHRRVLAAIVAGGGLTPDVNRALLEDAARIGSDYELAEFLIQMGKKGALEAATRDAYFAAADKIKSDYEHHRALTPLLSRDVITKELAKAILGSATRIDSDYECASLLVELAKAIPIDEDLRPAFERAADTIQGEYEYGRAMAAVRRRTMTR